VLCVRWHLRYRLSLRDLVGMTLSAVWPWLTRRSWVGSNGSCLSSDPRQVDDLYRAVNRDVKGVASFARRC